MMVSLLSIEDKGIFVEDTQISDEILKLSSSLFAQCLELNVERVCKNK